MASTWECLCLEERGRSLRAEIERERQKQHSCIEPRVILMALILVLNDTLDRFTNYRRSFESIARRNPNYGDALVLAFGSASKRIDIIADVFSLVDRVDSPRIPFEMLPSISWAAHDIMDRQFSVIVRLDAILNYSLASITRRFEEEGWQSFLSTAMSEMDCQEALEDRDILFLGVPSVDAGSILVHGVIAHELGHELYRKCAGEVDELISAASQDVKQDRRVSLLDHINYLVDSRFDTPTAQSRGEVLEQIRERFFAEIDQVAQNWSVEIFADLLAARLLGPAYLAAFDRVPPRKDQESHPPTVLRRNLIRKYLELAYKDILGDRVWRPLFDGPLTRARFRERDGKAKEIAQEVCERVLPTFERFFVNIGSPLSISAEDLNAVVEAIEEHITWLSPPSVPLGEMPEWGDARALWLVLFAAWHFRLSPKFDEFRKRYRWEVPAVAEDKLGNLVLQSFKALQLRSAWRAHRT